MTSSLDTQKDELLKNGAWLNYPVPTIEIREKLIVWIDYLREIAMNIFYTITPSEVWEQQENIDVVFVGCGDRQPNSPAIAPGMYAIDLPVGIPDKYRDPVAMAMQHFGKVPAGLPQMYIPVTMYTKLPKPSAHERMAAKVFLHKVKEEYKDNAEIMEWAEQLV